MPPASSVGRVQGYFTVSEQVDQIVLLFLCILMKKKKRLLNYGERGIAIF
jgi:hypothetical protein